MSTEFASFRFPCVWVGLDEQIKFSCSYYPEILETMEAAIVFDQANIKLKSETFENLDKVAGVGDVDSAFQFVQSFEEQRRVFLFTTEGEHTIADLDAFMNYTKMWK